MQDQRTAYGLEIGPTSAHATPRSVAAAPETSPSGNVILRVGRENHGGGGWHQTEHVVMTPDEAREYAWSILALAPEPVCVVIAEAKDPQERMGRGEKFRGTEAECEAYVERNSSPDNPEQYVVEVIA